MPLSTYNLNFLIADDNIKFDSKISPLLSACFIGKIEIVSLILENEFIDVDLESSPQKFTPLMVSCYKGFYEITRNLLEKKADVNKINFMGHRALLFCFSRLEENHFKYENKKICMMLVELLLSKGADINIRVDKNYGHTILMKLVSSDLSNKDNFEETSEMIRFLVERGADVNISGYDNQSVFDLITEDNLYKEELYDLLNSTKQIYFYNNSPNNLGKENRNEYDSEDKKLNNSIKIDSQIMKMNCCNICKIFFKCRVNFFELW